MTLFNFGPPTLPVTHEGKGVLTIHTPLFAVAKL